MFRGIFQEDEGFILQPVSTSASRSIRATAALNSVSANVGNWNSIHSGPTGGELLEQRSGTRRTTTARSTFAFGKFKPGVLFTSYTSPNDYFKSVQELAAVFTYDDSANGVPLSPEGRARVRARRPGRRRLRTRAPTSSSASARPSSSQSPAHSRHSRPRRLSLNDYYEGLNGSDMFGYLDTGVIASVPLPSTGKVSWEAARWRRCPRPSGTT